MKLGNGINQIRTLQKSIPGPKSIFGWRMNMIRFYRSPFMYSRWLHDTYGKVVTLGQGKKPSYVFAFGPELNEQILTNPDLFKVSSSLVKIPKDSLLGRMFFNNLIMMTGEKHKQHRRLMQPAFHRKQISEVEEIDMDTNKKLDALMEINIPTEEIMNKLRQIYDGWEVLNIIVKPLEYKIIRNEKSVLLKTNAITYAVRKNNL
ncbi:cytochrome P450 [Bacillus cereus]|uniref:Cytochrome P450 n=1 Tax=Bacillus cereus MC67 TaxID=1053219 RepID=J8BES3_BACCE|nr:cytochrome P450 [Bacillus cereus]EJQ92398.1 hypothetical protein II3_05440 [Bacillus cereus MC67]EOP08869.1 hypothetical protein II1_04076 [Bacillus cereus MC118]